MSGRTLEALSALIEAADGISVSGDNSVDECEVFGAAIAEAREALACEAEVARFKRGEFKVLAPRVVDVSAQVDDELARRLAEEPCAACIAGNAAAIGEAEKTGATKLDVFAFAFVLGMAELQAHERRGDTVPLCEEHRRDFEMNLQAMRERDAEVDRRASCMVCGHDHGGQGSCMTACAMQHDEATCRKCVRDAVKAGAS